MAALEYLSGGFEVNCQNYANAAKQSPTFSRVNMETLRHSGRGSETLQETPIRQILINN
jgi:hypothetical protein